MNVQGVKTVVQKKVGGLGKKITNSIMKQKDNFIMDKLCLSNYKLSSTLTDAEAQRVLNKVGNKAAQDWAKTHKVQDFILNNFGKIAKTGKTFIGRAIDAVVGFVRTVKNAIVSKKGMFQGILDKVKQQKTV